MFLSEAALGLCLLFLLCTWAAQVAATRNGDKRRLHSLHLVKLGLSLSACAYLLHIEAKSLGSPLSVLSVAFRFGGITFLWLAWKDHWTQQRERLANPAPMVQERDEALELRLALPPGYREVYSGLNSRAREVLCAAQEEALRRQCCCVDTDHLLLGLLQVPHTRASRILERAQVTPESVAWELARQAAPSGSSGKQKDAPVTAGLTPRVRQVLAMAEIEAHRFDKTFVGSEHLLLGLLLTGTGPAASVLFAAGLTVDSVRREVIAAGKHT